MLTTDPEFPKGKQLAAFSDLTRQEVQLVQQSWPLIPVARRLQTATALLHAAEEDLQIHLGRMWRILLTDEESQIRVHAVRGLWEELEGDLIGPLIDLLHHDPEGAVRAEAAAALGNYMLASELEEISPALGIKVEEALLSVLQGESDTPEVQSRALESIAFSGETGVRELIEDAYYSPIEEMRVSALRAMGRSADVRWRGLVRAELQNPDVEMRAEAARAAGELEDHQALKDLLELLGDESDEVRLAAIFSLGRLGGREAREALAFLIEEDAESAEAEAAEIALEEMLYYADLDAIPLLDENLDMDGWDPDSEDWDDDDLGVYEP